MSSMSQGLEFLDLSGVSQDERLELLSLVSGANPAVLVLAPDTQTPAPCHPTPQAREEEEEQELEAGTEDSRPPSNGSEEQAIVPQEQGQCHFCSVTLTMPWITVHSIGVYGDDEFKVSEVADSATPISQESVTTITTSTATTTTTTTSVTLVSSSSSSSSSYGGTEIMGPRGFTVPPPSLGGQGQAGGQQVYQPYPSPGNPPMYNPHMPPPPHPPHYTQIPPPVPPVLPHGATVYVANCHVNLSSSYNGGQGHMPVLASTPGPSQSPPPPPTPALVPSLPVPQEPAPPPPPPPPHPPQVKPIHEGKGEYENRRNYDSFRGAHRGRGRGRGRGKRISIDRGGGDHPGYGAEKHYHEALQFGSLQGQYMYPGVPYHVRGGGYPSYTNVPAAQNVQGMPLMYGQQYVQYTQPPGHIGPLLPYPAGPPTSQHHPAALQHLHHQHPPPHHHHHHQQHHPHHYQQQHQQHHQQQQQQQPEPESPQQEHQFHLQQAQPQPTFTEPPEIAGSANSHSNQPFVSSSQTRTSQFENIGSVGVSAPAVNFTPSITAPAEAGSVSPLTSQTASLVLEDCVETRTSPLDIVSPSQEAPVSVGQDSEEATHTMPPAHHHTPPNSLQTLNPQGPPPGQIQVPPPGQNQVSPSGQVQVPPPGQAQVPPPNQIQVAPPHQVQVPPPSQVQIPPTVQGQVSSGQAQFPPPGHIQVSLPGQVQIPPPLSQAQEPPPGQVQMSSINQAQAPLPSQAQAPQPGQVQVPSGQIQISSPGQPQVPSLVVQSNTSPCHPQTTPKAPSEILLVSSGSSKTSSTSQSTQRQQVMFQQKKNKVGVGVEQTSLADITFMSDEMQPDVLAEMSEDFAKPPLVALELTPSSVAFNTTPQSAAQPPAPQGNTPAPAPVPEIAVGQIGSEGGITAPTASTTVANSPVMDGAMVPQADTTYIPGGAWAQKKSWSQLFKPCDEGGAKQVAYVAPFNQGAEKPCEEVPLPPETVENKVPDPTLSEADIEKAKIGGMLRQYVQDHHHAALQPRGLINKANWCYINAPLQALLACPPFYNLMKNIPNIAGLKKGKSSTPVIDSIVEYIHEFSEMAPMLKPNKKEKSASGGRKEPEIVPGPPFEPSYVYKMLATINGDVFNDGRQQDAEEMLSFVLNGLHEEMVEALKLAGEWSPSPTGDHSALNGSVNGETNTSDHEDASDDSDEWQMMGPRKRCCVTRTAAFTPTPISAIFWGQLRSVLHQAGGNTTANLQPFTTLPLDIQSSKVESVRDALDQLVSKEEIPDYTDAKTNQDITVFKQVLLEHLPNVLILQLKRFIYDKDGGLQKVMKKVSFPVDLEITKELMSSRSRGKFSPVQRKYKLLAVVYHDGKEATKGHYVADIYHGGYNCWLRCDDSFIKELPESNVVRHVPPRVPYLLFYRRADTMVGPSPKTKS